MSTLANTEFARSFTNDAASVRFAYCGIRTLEESGHLNKSW